jgi:putative spermidine/putrescine transport system permease protein
MTPTSTINSANLKSQLKRAERRHLIRSYNLILPLFAFILISFLIPLGIVFYNSIYDPQVATGLPKTVESLKDWDVRSTPYPSENSFAALAAEMKTASDNQTASGIASRLNYEGSGLRTLFMKTSREVEDVDDGPWQEKFIAIDKNWAQPEIWSVIRQTGSFYTSGYYLKALDMQRDPFDNIEKQPADARIYIDVFARTLFISGLVTAFCFLLGYPIAYLLSKLPARTSNLLMIFVLLPFWTSMLVRTTAWIVLLQKGGVINSTLLSLGLISEPLDLMFNRFGVVVAMTHILLPFMILPLFSVMKSVPSTYVRAARSLGASPWTAFWKIYFPQSMPGVSAGGLLVFILAIGYYITPTLLGGAGDQMISYFIADNLSRSLNWGLASALGCILLAGILVFYSFYEKYVGVSNVKLG